MNEPTLFDIPTEDAIGELIYDTKCHETTLVFPDDLTIIRELAEHNAWHIDNDHTLAAEEWITKTYYHKLDMGDYSPGELDEYDSQIDALFGAVNEYQSEKKKFFCIYIPTDKWFIRPIFSPEEMIKEGKHMHHCVGGYWNRKDSLILVCRSFKDERIATIEINIQSKEIIQIRGLQNAKPKYYNQIHKVLNSRMADILHPTKKKFVKPLPLAA